MNSTSNFDKPPTPCLFANEFKHELQQPGAFVADATGSLAALRQRLGGQRAGLPEVVNALGNADPTNQIHSHKFPVPAVWNL
ncbi:hypothetical protein SNOG_03809 [Parastagonospora nodorum SN15]|uniref:Uncharacterized protein n=1 Tax=Phaeosphaeria nodorum (strain SN15 / ATCC MYA-4574 / FGSC 10173) TaxID=321614 RepID=Q0UWQ5_PHANO|nr:hypothetical protein SNOG_03809 [Parastagonospora nodorum SN15]EAT89014.1 hypothetical protein SNOG_03809 [Parastagonospora nodorum SN15]